MIASAVVLLVDSHVLQLHGLDVAQVVLIRNNAASRYSSVSLFVRLSRLSGNQQSALGLRPIEQSHENKLVQPINKFRVK